MSGSPEASSALKRKRGSESTKFYAVKIGKTPGVYNTWAECQLQITGFKGATFKSFTTLTEAEAFAAGRAVSSGKFYGVANGPQPGVYEDWSTTQSVIKGIKGTPKFKGFTSKAEAESFVRDHLALEIDGKAASRAVPPIENAKPNEATLMDAMQPKGKKAKTAASASNGLPSPSVPGWDPLPEDAEDGFDTRIKLDDTIGTLRHKTKDEREATISQANVNSATDTLHIYTDGACRSNGKKGAIAGVGVYFGPNDPRNLAEPLTGTRQTNQRAELTAIKRALEMTPFTRPTIIYSDSQYAIKCVTEWFQNWERNNWVSSSKKPVENRDLVEEILRMIRLRERAKASLRFQWIKGHADNAGNNAADELAVKGALEAKAGPAPM